MNSVSFYLFLLISLTAIVMSTTISATTIGVTYSSTPASIPGSAQLSPERIAAKFASMKIPAVRLLDSNPAMIRAFAYTNVSLLLSVPNPLVPFLATNRSLAMHWVHLHVLPFHRRTKISTISVGNDMISYSPDVSPWFLLGAMQNVHQSLADLRIYGISVSTTFSFFDIVIPRFQVQQQSRDVIIMEILRFLEKTNSSLLISLCPYNMFRSSCSNPIGFGRLSEKLPLNLRATGGKFRQLFDMMVAVVIRSVDDLPVIVAETGWPKSGIKASEVDATWLYSDMVLKALLAEGPLRKENESVSQVYLYDLVEKHHDDEDKWSQGYVEYVVLVFCVFSINMIVEILIDLRLLVIQQFERRRLRLREEELERRENELLKAQEDFRRYEELKNRGLALVELMKERRESLRLAADDPENLEIGDDEIYGRAEASLREVMDLLMSDEATRFFNRYATVQQPMD